MSEYLSARPRDQLKAYIKVGRLYDAERLLEKHGTARIRKTRKWSPLYMAVQRGFHSMVEMLLRYDHAQWDLEKCYQRALWNKRRDLASLILCSRCWSAPIDPVEAMAAGDDSLVKRLRRDGVELARGEFVLKAALQNPQGVIDALKALDIPVSNFEEELHVAMVTHIRRNNFGRALRLLRMGLDPHRVVTYLDDKDRPVDEGSAVDAAIYSERPGFLASLKPDPAKDDEEALIGSAVFMDDPKILEVLLNAGFRLNCNENGGSPALDRLLAGSVLGCGFPFPLFGDSSPPR